MKPWPFIFIALLSALLSGCASGPKAFSGNPASVAGVGTNAMLWRASMELAQGPHQLLVAALHPSGMFTAWATNSFTNSLADETASDSFDSAGNITNRVWTNPSGGVERMQTLSWDARNRLNAVTERDASNSGYNWTATYDGLNRRISTTSILVTNGVAFTTQPTTINSYYDPRVEFLELGVNYGNTTEFKLYGPALNGVYGGLNGVGGLDAVSPMLNLFEPVISDFRGNVLGVVTNGAGALSWNPARPTGYGSVPGYQPLPLANGADISLASAWRGRWADITGLYNVGLRPYDPVSGRWLTYDSVWNDGDPSGMTFCGGDPVNRVDADGRLGKNSLDTQSWVGMSYFNAPTQYQQQMQEFMLGALNCATLGLLNNASIAFEGQDIYGNIDSNQERAGAGFMLGLAIIPFLSLDAFAGDAAAELGIAAADMDVTGGEVAGELGDVATEETGATTWQEYQSAVNSLYGGEASFASRQFSTAAGNWVADNVVNIGGNQVAIESNFIGSGGWAGSIYNPASPVGNLPFAVAEQAGTLSQAQAYSTAFDQAIYHSNSSEFIQYYSSLFNNAGIKNIQFILTK